MIKEIIIVAIACMEFCHAMPVGDAENNDLAPEASAWGGYGGQNYGRGYGQGSWDRGYGGGYGRGWGGGSGGYRGGWGRGGYGHY